LGSVVIQLYSVGVRQV